MKPEILIRNLAHLQQIDILDEKIVFSVKIRVIKNYQEEYGD